MTSEQENEVKETVVRLLKTELYNTVTGRRLLDDLSEFVWSLELKAADDARTQCDVDQMNDDDYLWFVANHVYGLMQSSLEDKGIIATLPRRPVSSVGPCVDDAIIETVVGWLDDRLATARDEVVDEAGPERRESYREKKAALKLRPEPVR